MSIGKARPGEIEAARRAADAKRIRDLQMPEQRQAARDSLSSKSGQLSQETIAELTSNLNQADSIAETIGRTGLGVITSGVPGNLGANLNAVTGTLSAIDSGGGAFSTREKERLRREEEAKLLLDRPTTRASRAGFSLLTGSTAGASLLT